MQIRSVVIVAALGLASVAHGQSPAVQWRVEDGGNGHWYQRLVQATTWQSARDSCAMRGAHLATITTGGEQAMVAGVNGGMHCWLGGFQQSGAAEPGGGWYWITGEPWAYTNWLQATGEPNNVGGVNEDALQFHGSSTGWNDLRSNAAEQCICEWSADCDGNGVVDYGEILDGTLADTNANGVPDCCDAGVSCDPCPGDLNASGAVDAEDLAYVLFAWGTDGGKTPEADINHDGTVNANDLSVVLGSWGPCP